jgi:hypothetical protein
LPIAASLAARIKEIFGIAPQLVEGHNGIYEVAINRQVVVSNQGRCDRSATEEEILEEIRKHKSPLPGKGKMVRTIIPMMKV